MTAGTVIGDGLAGQSAGRGAHQGQLVGAAAAAVAGKFYFKAAEPKQRDLAAKRKNLASESKTLDLPAVRKSARRF